MVAERQFHGRSPDNDSGQRRGMAPFTSLATPHAAPQPDRVLAVVLDWAGTVVDHGSMAPAAVFHELFAQRGVTLTDAEVRAPMGLEKRDHITSLLEVPSIAQRWAAAHDGRPWSSDDVDDLYAAFLPLQLEITAAHAVPIPGALDTIAWLRSSEIAVGSTTGYNRTILRVLAEAAADHGYRPDVSVAADEARGGRPGPYMAWEALAQLQIWPPAATVKVDDTAVGIAEGRNAGMWTVAVACTGNEVGVDAGTWAALDEGEREQRAQEARAAAATWGADLVIDSIADLPPVIDLIDTWLDEGRRP